MMDIDWSKAPEGATHFDPVDRNYLRQFNGIALGWLNVGGWSTKGWQYPDDLSTMPRLIKRPEWPTEGQPPVGTTCERRFHDVEGSSWMGCIILAHGSKRIFYRDNCGDEFAHSLDEVQFRAFRTDDQIAADEREAEILALSSIISGAYGDRNTAIAVLDAGYRKQEQK